MASTKDNQAAQLSELLELRKRYAVSEKRLRESEYVVQRINAAAASVVYIFDVRTMRNVFVNQTALTLLGYSAADIQGMGANLVPALMHPDDQPRFALHLSRVRELRDDEVAQFEHRMRDRTGTWHWFEARDAVFSRDAGGRVAEIVGTATVITSRKKAELRLLAAIERFQVAAKEQPVVLFRQDLELRYKWLNSPFAGFAASELVGKRDQDVFERRKDAVVIDKLKRDAIRSRAGTRRVVIILSQQVVRHYDLVVAPVLDGAARIGELVCAAVDVTEFQQAQDAVRKFM